MIANIQCLIAACDKLHVPYRFLDANHNFVAVGTNPLHYFSNGSTPLNSEEVSTICRDKEFSYQLLNDVVRMPRTKGYFDPDRPDFAQYRTFDSHDEITKDITKSFSLPLVVKQNGGFQGRNVFVCETSDEIPKALDRVFDQDSKDYDFVALAQEHITRKKEFRVVTLFQKVVLIYEWSSGIIEVIEPGVMYSRIEKFVEPIFNKLQLNWSGLDVILDNDDNLCLIELNSKPGFEHFIEQKGKEKIVQIYEEMLRMLILA